ncbi:MAG: hypothetical protein SPF70_04035 [Lachnospiraceae bacterium]|nr:hypothetical protein [Lachnospiraceae bacterium]
MDDLIVYQLLGILCIVALILVFIIQGFLAVRAILLRSMSCWVMVTDWVILAVGIQVQSQSTYITDDVTATVFLCDYFSILIIEELH